MKRVTLNSYAKAHGLSLYQVIKAINQGVLQAETVKENGRRVRYVLVDEEKEVESGVKMVLEPSFCDHDMEKKQQVTMESLMAEVTSLRNEIVHLSSKLRQCCEKMEAMSSFNRS